MDMYKEITGSVDQYYQRLKTQNSFFVKALNGTLNPTQLAEYIFNLKYTVTQSIPQIGLGARRCKELGLPELSEYFKLKVKEEAGHHLWAQEDLENLKKNFGVDINMKLCEPMLHLVDYNKNLVKKDPRLYLVYILFAEYFTVLAGPEFLDGVDKKCQIQKSQISVLTKHVELDKDHVIEWKYEIEKCKVDFAPIYRETMQAFEDIMNNYAQFWEYVGSHNTSAPHPKKLRHAA